MVRIAAGSVITGSGERIQTVGQFPIVRQTIAIGVTEAIASAGIGTASDPVHRIVRIRAEVTALQRHARGVRAGGPRQSIAVRDTLNQDVRDESRVWMWRSLRRIGLEKLN